MFVDEEVASQTDYAVIAKADSLKDQLHEIWAYRELLFLFVWRDLKIRYRQTVLGVAWLFLQPLALMLVYTLILGRVFNGSQAAPYPVLVIVGLVAWITFSQCTERIWPCLVEQRQLLTKVYFPRMLLPLTAVASAAVDALPLMVTVLLTLAWFGVIPPPQILLLPLFVAAGLLTSLGLGLLLSSAYVFFRDIRYLVSFGLQLGFLLTPVFYPSTMVPGVWRGIAGINPMFTVVEGFRWCFLGTELVWTDLVLSATTCALLLVIGWRVFQAAQLSLTDVV